MRCGLSLTAMNYRAWPAFEKWEEEGVWTDAPIPDHQYVTEDVEIALLADELGYDSLWTVEHHLTPYNMVTNPLQSLSYLAGATKQIDFGTMVVVLPWHHPIRVAEDITMLHNLLGPDRKLTIGVGRGAARREFKGLAIPMDESRERFLEVLEVIKRALAQDVFDFDGEHYKFPRVSIRPRPRDGQSIIDNLHCAWGSAQTIPIAAEAGLKPLVIPQKPLEKYVDDLEEFARLRGASGHADARPLVALSLYCADNEGDARRGAEKYFTEYADGAIRSYELASRHFGNVKGYESYAQRADAVLDREKMAKDMGEVYVRDHVWGTPDQCVEKIKAIATMLQAAEVIVLPRIGDMGFETARKSVELFAREVLPAIHEFSPPLPAAESATVA